MNHYLKYCFILICLPFAAYSVSIKNSYWTCTTEDASGKQWTAQRVYQKTALNIAFDACKKESPSPETCKASPSACEGFYHGISTKPMWRCTALDYTAIPWQSNFYTQREDAALAAKAFCRQNSTVPDTCYINMVTCRNYNEGVRSKWYIP